MKLRVIAIALLMGGCEAPLIVDCDPGVFAEAEGDHWCIFNRAATVQCPELLPERHDDLPWGGYACASTVHRPVPLAELCVAVNECATDGGP